MGPIKKIEPPENKKKLKSFPGATQLTAKLQQTFENTDRLQNSLKKGKPLEKGDDQENDYNKKNPIEAYAEILTN